MDILRGLKTDDSQFSAIYMMDPDDDYNDESNWIKCNPSLDEVISRKYLRNQLLMCQHEPSQLPATLTKNFNMFCSSVTMWIPDWNIRKCMHKLDIRDFQNEICYIGCDFSAVSDLACMALVFPPNPGRSIYPDRFCCIVYSYLPEVCLERQQNQELYKQWTRNKHLFTTPGNVCDFDYILKDQLKLNSYLDIVGLYYDTWNAVSWSVHATNAGLPLFPYSQSLGAFNRPTKELERMVLTEKVVFDDNPIIPWSFANVSIKTDHADNVKPVKTEKAKKIDPVIAICQAIGGYFSENAYSDE